MSSPRAIHAPTPSYGLALLLIAFIALGAIYAVVTPLFEISDELWHYPMVKTLADGNGLPVQDPANVGPWRQEGSQPPLYYLLMGFITRWIDTGDIAQVRWINPHADNGLITQDRNNNIVIHTNRENWPWSGAVLAIRLIRLLSVLLGVGTVYFTYRLALELMPEQYGLALASAAFAAFTPMFLFISASVNNDNLAIFCSAGALWLLARWLRSPPQKIGWPHIWLGVLLGCGALSKQSALGLWPIAGAVLVYAQFSRKKHEVSNPLGFGIWRLGFEILIVFGLALLLSFWWYWRNYQLYGDWLGWNTFIAIVGRRPHPATLRQLWGERVGFVQAYWGLFGGVSVPMPGWTYTVLNLVMGLAMVGLGQGTVRYLIRRRMNLAETALWALPVAWVVLIVIGLIRWTSLTWASQGRLVFPAISAISVLVVAGLSELSRLFRLPPRSGRETRTAGARRPSAFILPAVAFMALLSTAVPFVVIVPHYAHPPGLTPAQTAAIPKRVDADFGGEMTLLGYALHAEATKPGEVVRLTLYWQSQIAMDRNWSIFVHVVDADGVIAAQRDRYPGQGALATTLLQPGQTFADEYVIPIPQTAYSPIDARLVVGLYDLTDGARLTLPDGRDALALASLPIQAHAADVPNPLDQNFGNLIRLAGYDMGPRALRPGETLELTLYWRALAPIRENYAVFAHVRGEGETLWAGEDAWPQKGASPTSGWQVGDLILDSYLLTLKTDTPPGLYDVEVGLYDSGTLERLRVMDAEGLPTDADFLFLSKIRVLP